jgi:hypothetical protein
MSKEIEDKLEKIPVINLLVRFGKNIKIPVVYLQRIQVSKLLNK